MSIAVLAYSNTSSFDLAGQLTGYQDALGRRQTYGYDGAGQRSYWQDALNQRTTYTYDLRGLETGRELASKRRVTTSYDARGMGTLVEDWTGRWTTTYDALGRPRTLNGPGHPSNQPFTYGYDPVGNRTSLEFGWGRFTYGYDALDRSEVLQDPGLLPGALPGGTTTWSYDARNQATRIDRPDGSRTTTVYDAAGRASQIRHSTSANADIDRAFYAYDAVGNPLVRHQRDVRFTFAYDALDQILSENQNKSHRISGLGALIRRIH